MNKNKISVTGCAGFIGYHLTKSLLLDGFEILGVDNLNQYYDIKLKEGRLEQLKKESNFTFKNIDISSKTSIDNLYKKFKPSVVVNLAAQAGVRYSIDNPYAYLNSNIYGFLNIIEACRNYNIDTLIYASSSSVYGNNTALPFSEYDKIDKPISLYGASKASNELIAYAYAHLYNINVTGLRFFTVYGPWGRPDMAMFIFTKNILEKKPIKVFNNGIMQRDFTYIDDIINGIRSSIFKSYPCEIFNLGNSKTENLLDMIKIIEDELKIKAIIEYEPLQAGDVIKTFADIDKSKEKLDYKPSVNINKGIPLFIKWYKEFYSK